MSLASVFFAYIISVTTFLILPGPVNLFVVNATLKYGTKGTIFAIIGSNLASLILIGTAGFLIAGADFINPLFLDSLTLLGGLFLLYYGIMQVKELLMKRACDAQDDIKDVSKSSHSFEIKAPISLISQAFAIGISNPKDVIFFLAFFPPFILQMGFSIPYSLLILTLIWTVLDYTLLFSYGMFTKRFIKGRFEKIFTLLCGLIFCGIGIYAIYFAIMALFE
ncbi:LysE family translocator [Ignatzschineria sp. LJL83]